MWRYVVRRLFWMIFILLGTAFIIFTIMYFVPGDPADMLLSADATFEEKQAYREMLGLNDPYFVQLVRFLRDTFIRFDFGVSYSFKVPVLEELISRIPRTFMLSLFCMLLDICIGMPLGITAAMHQDSIVDRLIMVIAMVGISVPNFWLALMMILLFTLRLNWLPAYGIETWKHWVMPILASGLMGIANNARQSRSAVLETIRADFVTTARAKGVPERSVIYKHMLPNALIPIVNMLGTRFANSIAGTVVIESVFTFPGVGLYMMTGINNRDYPIVRSCVIVLAAFSSLAILLTDIAYAYIDPRIKAQYAGAGRSHK